MDDDEEVLLTLAEILPQQLEFAGGPQYAEHVLRPLEQLCSSEETTVRDKVSEITTNAVKTNTNILFFCQATESVKQILSTIQIRDFEVSIMGMIQRLMNGECFTSKFAAVQLFPMIYPNLTPANQQEMMTMYNAIS